MKNILRKGEKYKVLSEKFIDCYHYHGSWFDYTWELELETNTGEVIKGIYDTGKCYKNLTGKYIEHYNLLESQSYEFKVCEQNLETKLEEK